MTKQEQNLKYLRKLVWVLKEGIEKSREKFISEADKNDYGEFWNRRINYGIDGELRELKDNLEEFIHDLTVQIKNIENKEK